MINCFWFPKSIMISHTSHDDFRFNVMISFYDMLIVHRACTWNPSIVMFQISRGFTNNSPFRSFYGVFIWHLDLGSSSIWQPADGRCVATCCHVNNADNGDAGSFVDRCLGQLFINNAHCFMPKTWCLSFLIDFCTSQQRLFLNNNAVGSFVLMTKQPAIIHKSSEKSTNHINVWIGCLHIPREKSYTHYCSWWPVLFFSNSQYSQAPI